MKKGTLNANGLQIAYCIWHPEKEPTIFFIHGNSSSSNNWRKQVESDLFTDYRLITIDLPNHGNSATLNENADFSLPGIAKIMAAAALQLVNNAPYIICSVSLGTNIVAEMLNCDIKPVGLIMAGPCIVGEGFGMEKLLLPGADPSAVFAENVPHESVVKYAGETSISSDVNDITYFLKDYYSVQGNFRSALYATIAAGNYNDEVAILQRATCPVCIVFGEAEKVVNTSYLDDAPINVWNNKVYKIAGASHLVNIDAPMAFNELLAAFAKDIFTINVA
ncbi:alpha/beta hydrolase [soil metagenome]